VQFCWWYVKGVRFKLEPPEGHPKIETNFHFKELSFRDFKESALGIYIYISLSKRDPCKLFKNWNLSFLGGYFSFRGTNLSFLFQWDILCRSLTVVKCHRDWDSRRWGPKIDRCFRRRGWARSPPCRQSSGHSMARHTTSAACVHLIHPRSPVCAVANTLRVFEC